jgi:hypothetical protein
MAGVEGLEPPTPGFGDRCSSQLSYTPNARGNKGLACTRGRTKVEIATYALPTSKTCHEVADRIVCACDRYEMFELRGTSDRYHRGGAEGDSEKISPGRRPATTSHRER